jgi:phosphatidylinositol glycan class K
MSEEGESHAWFVTAGTSRYFFNYRHASDSLTFHHLLRTLNVSESQILSWDAASVIDSPLNPHRGVIFSDPGSLQSVVTPDMHIGASHEAVSVELLQDTLTLDESAFVTKYGEYTSTLTDSENNRVTLFLSGHGGNEFFKFHDYEEIDAVAFARMIKRMQLSGRFQKMLILIDTCQASTMGTYLKGIPNVIFVASSQLAENSYALNAHDAVGLSTIDRFSYQMASLQTRKKVTGSYPSTPLRQLEKSFPYEALYSHVSTSFSNNHSFSAFDMNMGNWLKGGVSKKSKDKVQKVRWTEFIVKESSSIVANAAASWRHAETSNTLQSAFKVDSRGVNYSTEWRYFLDSPSGVLLAAFVFVTGIFLLIARLCRTRRR